MPTLPIIKSELQKMVKIERNELERALSLLKAEVKGEEDDILYIKFEDTNRPDLWSLEGLVRALRLMRGIGRKYKVRGNALKVIVDKRVYPIRPFIGCALVKGAKLSDAIIKQLMWTQECLDMSYGRRRKRTSIGLYNADLVTPPIYYTVADPITTSFIPLGFEEELTLKEILKQHPKGKQYGHLIASFKRFPILKDAEGKMLSMPPIINSASLGQISEETENILIEATGTNRKAVEELISLLAGIFAERGCEIRASTILYPNSSSTTPSFASRKMELETNSVKELLGIQLSPRVIEELLKKAGFKCRSGKGMLEVEIPFWRTDVMHQVDLIEEIAIFHGYERIEPIEVEIAMKGEAEKWQEKIRELMIGCGATEVLSFTLTNEEMLFDRMNLKRGGVVEIENPMIQTYSCLRNWLLPCLMEFLSKNAHHPYPQKVFEVGSCVELQSGNIIEKEKLACAVAHSKAGFGEAHATLDFLMKSIKANYALERIEHPSFINGRAGRIIINGKAIGIIGELHPKVLNNWNIQNPVACFELELDPLKPFLEGD